MKKNSRYSFIALVVFLVVLSTYYYSKAVDEQSLNQNVYNDLLTTYKSSFSNISNKKQELTELTTDNLHYIKLKLSIANKVSDPFEKIHKRRVLEEVPSYFLERLSSLDNKENFKEKEQKIYEQVLNQIGEFSVYVEDKDLKSVNNNTLEEINSFFKNMKGDYKVKKNK